MRPLSEKRGYNGAIDLFAAAAFGRCGKKVGPSVIRRAFNTDYQNPRASATPMRRPAGGCEVGAFFETPYEIGEKASSSLDMNEGPDSRCAGI